ncbi:MAG: MATE family efflux transporter [Clostridia bacterium]|nr:MATE family efflux transporter [Clostridia bacterium]
MFTKQRTFLAPPVGSRFTNRQLTALFLPLLLEQFLLNLSALSDTFLASVLSDAATAGVSHAFTISNLAACLIYGLATGGSIVTAQWIGARDRSGAAASARTSLLFTILISAVLCTVLIVRPAGVIRFLLGDIPSDVMEYAVTYLIYSALTLPCYAVVYVSTASFRAIGNTKVPMYACAFMLGISLLGKWLLSVVLKLGVLGTALSNLIGAALTAAGLVIYMQSGRSEISYRLFGKAFLPGESLRRVFRISVPSGIENMTGAVALLLLQRIVAGSGIAQSAAHGIASRLQPYAYLPAYCWGTVGLVIVGQYCGADDRNMARLHTKHILKLCYAWMIPLNLVLIACSSFIIRLFGGTEESLALAQKLFLFYCCFAMLFYSTMNALAQCLRGAGDTRYTMTVSLISMFFVWVGLAMLFSRVLQLGVFSVWLAMALHYIVCSVCFILRCRGSRWLSHEVLRKGGESSR